MNKPHISQGNGFHELMAVIEDRKAKLPAASYTTSLFSGGIAKIGDKILEEAGEVVEAGSAPADERDRQVVHETADLVYHLFVLLGHLEIPLAEVEAELKRRFGVSGLEEKASRGQKGGTL